MRVAFLMDTAKYLRHYDATVDALLDEGHEVLLGFTDASREAAALEGVRAQVLGDVPRRSSADGARLRRLATLIDFARYLDPRFAGTPVLRENHRERLVDAAAPARALARRDTLPAPLARGVLRTLVAAHRAVPPDPAIVAYLRELDPDAVVVTPLVMANLLQTEYVRAARALGIPTAACIASWDNLTTKGLIREQPDRVVVWNEPMRREAVELHGVPDGNVVVTGAQPFDRWFGRSPTVDRQAFCRRAGLDPERPYVLFAGSLSNGWPGEIEDAFLPRWIAALRASGDPRVAGAGILFRPHPERAAAWTGVDLSGVEQAVLWPAERPSSVTPAARGDYFDSLFHSAAIVGINTSAMVEGAIVGRPVMSVLQPEFHLLHDGNLHFAYLRPENGGFLHLAADLGEHVAQLGAVLAAGPDASARNRPFVEAFIRPRGADQPANEHLVAAIGELAALRPSSAPARRRRRDRLALAAVRPAVDPVRPAARLARALEGHRVPGARVLQARVTRREAEARRLRRRRKAEAAERRERLLERTPR